jgi:hypothetical protein
MFLQAAEAPIYSLDSSLYLQSHDVFRCHKSFQVHKFVDDKSHSLPFLVHWMHKPAGSSRLVHSPDLVHRFLTARPLSTGCFVVFQVFYGFNNLVMAWQIDINAISLGDSWFICDSSLELTFKCCSKYSYYCFYCRFEWISCIVVVSLDFN